VFSHVRNVAFLSYWLKIPNARKIFWQSLYFLHTFFWTNYLLKHKCVDLFIEIYNCIFIYLCISFLIWSLLPSHCKCRGVLLHFTFNDTDTQICRHTETHTDTQTHKHRDIHTHRHTPHTHTTQKHIHTHTQTHTHTRHTHTPDTHTHQTHTHIHTHTTHTHTYQTHTHHTHTHTHTHTRHTHTKSCSFPSQQWLRHRTSLLRYTYMAYRVCSCCRQHM